MNEEWKQVCGYEGLYSVSNLGRVRNDVHRKNSGAGRILKPWKAGSYPAVTLWANGVSWKTTVHRLVAQAFVHKPEGAVEVNHKNGNREDSSAHNLEWISHQENMRHAFKTGLVSRKLNRDSIAAIQVFRTKTPLLPVCAIAKKFGVSKAIITRIWRDDHYAENCPS